MPPRPRTIPRKTAVQERSRATVDVILQATARILVKDGYDRASTNRIAEAAGVSIGSLYQYFPSKEALVAALIERHMDEMSAVVAAAAARLHDAPLEVAARELVRTMIAAHAVDPKLHRVLVEQVPRVGRLEKIYDVEAHATGIARGYLEAHRAEVRRDDLDLAAFMVVHVIEALTHCAVLLRPDLLGEPLIEEISDLLVRYLARDAPRLLGEITPASQRRAARRAAPRGRRPSSAG
ncbi:MAG: TetR/AcrR family transcriptional regulator [Polyangiales bacterium]